MLLLLNNGRAEVFGEDTMGQCKIPTVDTGFYTFTEVAGGAKHSALIRKDGTAIIVGYECYRTHKDWDSRDATETDYLCVMEGKVKWIFYWPQADFTYTHVVAGGYHTVLKRSDGVVVAYGSNSHGECDIPKLPDGLMYFSPQKVVLQEGSGKAKELKAKAP